MCSVLYDFSNSPNFIKKLLSIYCLIYYTSLNKKSKFFCLIRLTFYV
nr:MAG TPA: hypothetical protein [Caudoviricetes sp.]